MLPVGISNYSFFDDLENQLPKMKQAGVCDMEISLRYEDCCELDIQSVSRLAEKNGIRLWSYHLPFGWTGLLDLGSTDEKIRTFSVEKLSEFIRQGASVGIQTFVVHPSSEPKSLDAVQREIELNYATQSLHTLTEVATQQGAVLAIENLPRSCLGANIAEMERLVSCHEKARICFDTNHMLQDSNLEFVERLGSKIVTLHVSDYDFADERHWLPGEGNIDWHALYAALYQKGYRGPWLYEVSLYKPKRMKRSRALTFSDFVQNATQIANGQPLSVYTERYEE